MRSNDRWIAYAAFCLATIASGHAFAEQKAVSPPQTSSASPEAAMPADEASAAVRQRRGSEDFGLSAQQSDKPDFDLVDHLQNMRGEAICLAAAAQGLSAIEGATALNCQGRIEREPVPGLRPATLKTTVSKDTSGLAKFTAIEREADTDPYYALREAYSSAVKHGLRVTPNDF